MGIDVRMRKLAYVTYRTEKWATIPENANQDLSRYTKSVVVGDRPADGGGRIRIVVACARPISWLRMPRTTQAVLDGPMGAGHHRSVRHRYKQPKKPRQYQPGLPISNAV